MRPPAADNRGGNVRGKRRPSTSTRREIGAAQHRVMTLHPALRLVLLIALGASLFAYSLTAQAAVLLLLLLFTARGGRAALAGTYKALRRIRWLLISIAVIYLLVAPAPTPGS